MKSLRESFEENYEPVEVPCSNRRGFRIRYELSLIHIWCTAIINWQNLAT